MRLRFLSVATTALVCAVMLVPDALAQRGDRDRDRQWVQLGCQDVSFRGRDRDSIRVGRREGRFRALRLTARGNDVEIRRVSVIYGNGAPNELDVQRMIRRGDRSDRLDLRGGDRAISRIDMVYRQRDDFPGRATVCAEGLLG